MAIRKPTRPADEREAMKRDLLQPLTDDALQRRSDWLKEYLEYSAALAARGAPISDADLRDALDHGKA